MIDYRKPTPETDRFMTLIDGDEINLEQVRARLHDMEIQRDYERARSEMWKRLAIDAGVVLNAHAIGQATQKVIDQTLMRELSLNQNSNYISRNVCLPHVVCLCGSTRFRTEITEANRRATMEGSVVLAPGVFGHSGDPMTDDDKRRLDRLHLDKINMADEIRVVNPGGYIGESTRREIDYAMRIGKPIAYTHPNG